MSDIQIIIGAALSDSSKFVKGNFLPQNHGILSWSKEFNHYTFCGYIHKKNHHSIIFVVKHSK